MSETNQVVALIEAIKVNDVEAVKLLIDSKVDVNGLIDVPFYEPPTPLHAAVMIGNTEIISSLISAGADVNIHNRMGETPLFHFLKNEHFFGHLDGGKKVILLLLENGADIYKPLIPEVKAILQNENIGFVEISRVPSAFDKKQNVSNFRLANKAGKPILAREESRLYDEEFKRQTSDLVAHSLFKEKPYVADALKIGGLTNYLNMGQIRTASEASRVQDAKRNVINSNLLKEADEKALGSIFTVPPSPLQKSGNVNVIFDSLDMSKVMHFSDGSSLNFRSAQTQLAIKIGLSAYSDSQEIETKIFNALIYREDIATLTSFFIWIHNIHNDRLVPPSSARYPNNIIYDMLAHLRNKNYLTPEETLLQFFLEGANARKISKGKTPSLYFIATSLLLNTIEALENLGITNPLYQQFMQKYKSINNYAEAQRKLESAATELKKDPIYGFLSTQNIFEFKKEKNEETGAERYLSEEAITRGTASLTSYENKDELNSDIEKMVNKIQDILKEITPAFVQAQHNATESADSLAKWDASEWVARLYVALRITANHDKKFQEKIDAFRKNPFFGDILLRNEIANYPANIRNADIEKLDITQLFTQSKLAEQTSLGLPQKTEFKAR